jgi:hypothetical protein
MSHALLAPIPSARGVRRRAQLAQLLNPRAYQAYLRRKLGLRWVIDLAPEVGSTLFLAGTARSGTTWLSDLINFRNDYRYVFEPFHGERVPETRGFGFRTYLRPDAAAPDKLAVTREILCGRIRNPWTERFNRRLIARKRLIKEVRANLFLKWLRENFPELRIGFVLRHPCAVAQSHSTKNYGDALEALLHERELVQDFLAPHRKFLAGLGGCFERAVALWCIETLVPLAQLAPGDVHLMFYEDLLGDPDGTLRKLFTYLGRPFDPAIHRVLARPSPTSTRESAVTEGRDPLTAWQERVSPEQTQSALAMLDRFGLGGIYDASPLPNADALFARFGHRV